MNFVLFESFVGSLDRNFWMCSFDTFSVRGTQLEVTGISLFLVFKKGKEEKRTKAQS
jgi:hypothetical protein